MTTLEALPKSNFFAREVQASLLAFDRVRSAYSFHELGLEELGIGQFPLTETIDVAVVAPRVLFDDGRLQLSDQTRRQGELTGSAIVNVVSLPPRSLGSAQITIFGDRPLEVDGVGRIPIDYFQVRRCQGQDGAGDSEAGYVAATKGGVLVTGRDEVRPDVVIAMVDCFGLKPKSLYPYLGLVVQRAQ